VADVAVALAVEPHQRGHGDHQAAAWTGDLHQIFHHLVVFEHVLEAIHGNHVVAFFAGGDQVFEPRDGALGVDAFSGQMVFGRVDDRLADVDAARVMAELIEQHDHSAAAASDVEHAAGDQLVRNQRREIARTKIVGLHFRQGELLLLSASQWLLGIREVIRGHGAPPRFESEAVLRLPRAVQRDYRATKTSRMLGLQAKRRKAKCSPGKISGR
jgi:hypothetical protein